jgi:hypothetical protein
MRFAQKSRVADTIRLGNREAVELNSRGHRAR